MKQYSPEEMRQRWENGTMPLDEWNSVIEAQIKKDKETAGKLSAIPQEWDTAYAFPINQAYITEDFIRRFAYAIGNPDPLYHDPAYGKKSLWGTMVAPPIFASVIAWGGAFPEKTALPGWNAMHGGTEHNAFKPIRPGDTFRVINKYLGSEEKNAPNKPYRLFVRRNERSYINQREELVANCIANEVIMATPPGKGKATEKKTYEGRERHRYTQPELDMIHKAYDDELEGKNRRGAQILFWEEVKENDELKPVIKGPLDISDVISWIGMGGYIMAFALKWKVIKPNLGRALIDPETGEQHLQIDWHYLDSMARVMGMPYALSAGRQTEGCMSHLVSNWMGDDGFVKKLSAEHRGVWFHGETFWFKGRVTRKYVENNEHLVDIDIWSENILTGMKGSLGKATVKLISKTE
jgi:acyl dehydratase